MERTQLRELVAHVGKACGLDIGLHALVRSMGIWKHVRLRSSQAEE